MKQLLTIIFLNLLLFKTFLPATDTYELSKLPTLIEHYSKHRNENPDMTLWAFLMLHYENPQHHAEDRAHSDLPFSGHHNDNCTLQFWYTSPGLSLQFSLGMLHDNVISRYIRPAQSSFLATIWQPPRMG